MNSVPIVEIKINDDSPGKKDKRQSNSGFKNKEIKATFSLREPDNRNKKIIKIQQDNINGNYGKIYIKENPSSRYSYKFNQNENKPSLVPNRKKEIKKVYTVENNNNNNNNINNKRRIISVDNKYERKNKEEEKNDMKEYNLRKKSIDRGGNYNNIQVTHIIYSTRMLNFHIIDPLMEYTEEMRKKNMKKVDPRYKNGKDGKVKVSYNCSCDNIFLKPNKKVQLKGTITSVPHRQNIRTKSTINDNNRAIKIVNRERKEGKEGKDSTMKINMRNKKNVGNKGINDSASYKKRNEKNFNNNINNMNIKKIK